LAGGDPDEDISGYLDQYPTDFFDLIVIDECHRAGANAAGRWREVLKRFAPSVHLGLTATPKRDDNVDTYEYFDEPVCKYLLKQGVNDGFLTPFKVYPTVGTMDEYVYTPGDGVVVKGNPKPGRVYKEGDFNRIITIPARERKRVEYWMDKFKPNEKHWYFAPPKHTQAWCAILSTNTPDKRVGPPIPLIVCVLRRMMGPQVKTTSRYLPIMKKPYPLF
jgi:type I restriction enzyme R subunit